ncbi:MAG: UDP-glucose/GDP-mannose dehydrogenase family protein [Spirochaetales bacterium]|nr:UDP-glucose/GDP-mannose dehydrogenase family protein [Spirochaetales bacterium]
MAKEITVVGTGYVGLIAAVGLADFGNQVTGVDLDADKIKMLNEGKSPIYEAGIGEFLNRNMDSERLTFTTDIKTSVKKADVIFIAVGTPEREDGTPNLDYVDAVVNSIGENMDGFTVIVTKSTVPVGTNRRIKTMLTELKPDGDFEVVSNPEFLREGRAVEDFFHPDRTVIGYETERAKDVMFEVYRTLNVTSVPFVWCSLETAELIKYASNAFLATKITFINQMANLAETVGADIHMIAKSMGMDGRISPYFLHPGPGYGGSCFPKDTKAVVDMGDKLGVDMSLIRSVISANEAQKVRMVVKLEKLCGNLKGKTAAVLGLAFKQQTDDIRESPALTIIKSLEEKGCHIQAHDPKAMDNFEKEFPHVLYCNTAYDACKNADVLIIATEWNEYRGLDLERVSELMNEKVILDTRNLLDVAYVKKSGFKYQGVGRG